MASDATKFKACNLEQKFADRLRFGSQGHGMASLQNSCDSYRNRVHTHECAIDIATLLRFKSLVHHDLHDIWKLKKTFVFAGKMRDFQRDLDRDHVPHDSNREARAHVSDAIQIATPAHVRTTVGSDG